MSALLAEDPSKERTTTDDALPVQGAATGQIEESTRKFSMGLRGALSVGVVTAASFSSFSTPALFEAQKYIPPSVERSTHNASVAQALSQISERYECVLFSYPGYVVDIDKNVSGAPVSVAVLVSVDGKDTLVRRPLRQFHFEVRPDMRLIVDGIKRGGVKQLAFRQTQPVELDSEQEELLQNLVAAFKSSTDA